MIVVSDTSPIRALAHLDLLWLLDQLYDAVIIPPAVAQELAVDRPPLRALGIAKIAGVQIASPRDLIQVNFFAATLDLGESEAIALALERQIHVLLIDEKRGRKAATQAGLKTLGVLGLLIQAKESRCIQAVEPLMNRLREEISFFISDSLWHRVLDAAGEGGQNARHV